MDIPSLRFEMTDCLESDNWIEHDLEQPVSNDKKQKSTQQLDNINTQQNKNYKVKKYDEMSTANNDNMDHNHSDFVIMENGNTENILKNGTFGYKNT